MLAFPIGCDFVVLFWYFFEVLCMFNSYVFYSKIAKDQCELDWSPIVFPQTWDKFALPVATFVETIFEEFISKQAGLGESAHAFIGLNIYEAIRSVILV